MAAPIAHDGPNGEQSDPPDDEKFDFGAPAELYIAQRHLAGRQVLSYRRFDTAAEAIRCVVEELPTLRQSGTILEVNERRHSNVEIHALYDNPAYPLNRAGE
jgi:hypothetical protein